MDNRTLTALRKSITHWEENSKATDFQSITIGQDACALCQEFNNGLFPCSGCPVKEKTGHSGCKGTPYDKVASSITFSGSKEFALEEVAFLKSLLPEKTTIFIPGEYALRGGGTARVYEVRGDHVLGSYQGDNGWVGTWWELGGNWRGVETMLTPQDLVPPTVPCPTCGQEYKPEG